MQDQVYSPEEEKQPSHSYEERNYIDARTLHLHAASKFGKDSIA